MTLLSLESSYNLPIFKKHIINQLKVLLLLIFIVGIEDYGRANNNSSASIFIGRSSWIGRRIAGYGIYG
jgi:hypothetical protein